MTASCLARPTSTGPCDLFGPGGMDLHVVRALDAEDLRIALRSLGRITGAVDVEDLLDVIFREFCIGK